MYNFDKEVNRFNTNSYKWDVKENELPMWVADMDFEVAPFIKEALQKKLDENVYGYSYVTDEFYLSYKHWWKERYNVDLDTKWMVFSTGVVASLSSIVRKLTTIGENVLVQTPVYNCFFTSIKNSGRNVVENELIYQDGTYSIDFVDLENKLKDEQTTMMIVCNPHNPVGKIFSLEELSKMLELCHKYHVQMVVDEIHCDMTDPKLKYVPILSINNTSDVVVLLAPSKTFNIAGLHASIAVVKDDNLRHKVWRGINTDEVGEPNFFCQNAHIAAYTKGKEYVEELNQYIYDNKQLFIKYLKENLPHLIVTKSNATYLLWVNISYYKMDSETFCTKLREETGLFITPGIQYGQNGDNFFRINMATTKKNVLDACERLKKFLDGRI